MSDKQLIYDLIERETGRQVDMLTPIEALGLDSLEFLNLLQEIESELGVRVDDSALPVNAKVGDIVVAVLGH